MAVPRDEFYRLMKHPVKSRFFLFSKLPAAYFAGVRLREIDEKSCRVTVPYKWLSQNPFRSTYFACLSMAAEMSTGALALSNVYKSDPPVSMLVTKVEADYYKKVTGRSSFICNDGELFREAVQEAKQTAEPKIVRAHSVGTNDKGEVVAEFFITWSFKVKSSEKNKVQTS